MLCCHAPAVAGSRMIIGRFFDVAPVAAWSQVRVIICAAGFERDDVIDVPIISRAKTALAFVATSAGSLEHTRSTLRRHAPAGVV